MNKKLMMSIGAVLVNILYQLKMHRNLLQYITNVT